VSNTLTQTGLAGFPSRIDTLVDGRSCSCPPIPGSLRPPNSLIIRFFFGFSPPYEHDKFVSFVLRCKAARIDCCFHPLLRAQSGDAFSHWSLVDLCPLFSSYRSLLPESPPSSFKRLFSFPRSFLVFSCRVTPPQSGRMFCPNILPSLRFFFFFRYIRMSD